MAIAYDSSAIGSDSGPTGTLALTIAAGSNRILIVTTIVNRSGLTIAWNGTPLTEAITQVIDTGVRADMWYLIAPEAGAYNVEFAGMSSAGAITIAAVSLTGVHQTVPFGAKATEFETTASTTFDINLKAAGSWTVENQSENDNITNFPIAQSNSQTERQEAGAAYGLCLATKAFTAPGSNALGFSSGGAVGMFHQAIEVIEANAQLGGGSFLKHLV